MGIIVELNSGVTDGNGKELFAVYRLCENGTKRNKRYFSRLENAYITARKESKINNCKIVIK